MARPSKYDWDNIKKAFYDGIEVQDICRKYKIAKKTLQNKIYEEKWEITGTLNSDIDEFRAVMGKLEKSAENDAVKAEIIAEKITTILEDNKIIQNNRKLAQLAQQIIIRDRDKIKYENIRTLTGAIKDLESVANPKESIKIDNNNTNAQQNNEIIGYGVETIEN